MVAYLNTCANILAGGALYLPTIGLDKLPVSKTVKEFSRNYFGASLGAFTYQAITLSNNPFLLANITGVSLAISAVGTVASKFAHDADKKLQKENEAEVTANKCKVFYVAFAANALIGGMSIYCGRYEYGISALGFTAAFLVK